MSIKSLLAHDAVIGGERVSLDDARTIPRILAENHAPNPWSLLAPLNQ
jgi:hypothetical protein